MRTLERQIGAVCRAVAVKVAENLLMNRASKSTKDDQEKRSAATSEGKQKMKEEALVDAVEMVLPPEMPIIIDEQAVEDILGVSGQKSSKFHSRWRN